MIYKRYPFLMADGGGQGGNLVATTQNFVNAYTGAATAFDSANTMTPEVKTWYDTEALENARANHVHAQFAKNIPLPANHGTSVEVRHTNIPADAFDNINEGWREYYIGAIKHFCEDEE